MEQKMYFLEGDCGIVAINPETNQVIEMGNYKELTSFKNMELLKASLEREKIKNYKIGFIISDDKLDEPMFIDYSEVIKKKYYSGCYYQAISDNNIIEIVPIVREKMFKCGYISFTDNPQERIVSYQEGKELNNRLYNMVKEAASYLLRCGVIKSCEKDESICPIDSENLSPFKYSLYGTTTTFRIMRGFELIKINENRKACGNKVLPFKANFDKYKNIYFCFCRDENEFKGDKVYHNIAEDIEKKIMDYLVKNYPDMNPTISFNDLYYPIKL